MLPENSFQVEVEQNIKPNTMFRLDHNENGMLFFFRVSACFVFGRLLLAGCQDGLVFFNFIVWLYFVLEQLSVWNGKFLVVGLLTFAY